MSAAADGALLRVENLSVDIAVPAGTLHAVNAVSFAVRSGETFCLVGESGCGKTITSLALMRLLPKRARLRADAIAFEGRNLLALSEREMAALRGDRIGMIFQDPMTSLNPYLRVADQLIEPLLIHERMERREALRRGIEALEAVGINDAERRMQLYPHEFSGGMRQRVMIAMALITRPELLIADEPTTALDVTVQAQILSLLRDLQKELNMGILLITHDLGVVAQVSDRVNVMYAGRIVEQGPVNDVFYHPMAPYTVGLLNSVPRLENEKLGRLPAIPGLPPSLINLPTGCSFSPRCEFRKHAPEGLCRSEQPELLGITPQHVSRCHIAEELRATLFASTTEGR